MNHEKQTSPTRQVAEIRLQSDDAVDYIVTSAEQSTGVPVQVRRETLAFDPWDQEAASAIRGIMQDVADKDAGLRGIGIMSSELNIEGSDEKQPVIGFVAHADFSKDTLEAGSAYIVEKCNETLEAVESPLRLPQLSGLNSI